MRLGMKEASLGKARKINGGNRFLLRMSFADTYEYEASTIWMRPAPTQMIE